MEKAFHGRTIATLTATGSRKVQAGFEPLLSGFVRVPFDDLEAVRRVAASNRNVVAVLVELVQGEGGINICHSDYLNGLRAICDQNRWLLMYAIYSDPNRSAEDIARFAIDGAAEFDDSTGAPVTSYAVKLRRG